MFTRANVERLTNARTQARRWPKATERSDAQCRSAARSLYQPTWAFPIRRDERGNRPIDEVVDVMGRATVEAVLQMSAEQVAGPKAAGAPRARPGGVLAWGCREAG